MLSRLFQLLAALAPPLVHHIGPQQPVVSRLSHLIRLLAALAPPLVLQHGPVVVRPPSQVKIWSGATIVVAGGPKPPLRKGVCHSRRHVAARLGGSTCTTTEPRFRLRGALKIETDNGARRRGESTGDQQEECASAATGGHNIYCRRGEEPSSKSPWNKAMRGKNGGAVLGRCMS